MAVSLPRLVEQLVGKEGVSLKLENPEKYHFDPDKLLSLLVKVILVFSESSQFILCMNEEGTLDMNVFKRAARICKARNLLEFVRQRRACECRTTRRGCRRSSRSWSRKAWWSV